VQMVAKKASDRIRGDVRVTQQTGGLHTIETMDIRVDER